MDNITQDKEIVKNGDKLDKLADIYFQSENTHSYADTEEELKEDITAAFKAGYKACEAEFVKLYGQFWEVKK